FGAYSIYSIDAPCALGGALQSIGMQCNDIDNYSHVRDAWPWLNGESLNCPACDRRIYDALNGVYHLNDDHKWNREQIAEWVASIEPQDEQTDGGQGPVEVTLEVTTV